jgi:2-polyprenyl-3-methyl-5-hydroxy-6-metoxy-1,4-benzoquinol methylase
VKEKQPHSDWVVSSAMMPREWTGCQSDGQEEPNCLLCGGTRRALVLRGRDNAVPDDTQCYLVVRCLDCGLCFTSPRPTAEIIGRHYPECYAPHKTPSQSRRIPWRARLATYLGWPFEARGALPWHGQGRLLDFGCGGGSFLQRMNRLGWRVTGLDSSPRAIERIRSQLGLNALVGSLPHPELPEASFDVVTMWHSLEHVHDPLAVLKSAHRILTPGGRLLVAAPNIDSLPFRWFGRAWFGLDLPRHLTHFAPATLRAMLDRAGFRVRWVQLQRHSRWLRKSATIALQQGIPLGWRRCLKRKVASRLVTSYCLLTGQTDCILAMADC